MGAAPVTLGAATGTDVSIGVNVVYDELVPVLIQCFSVIIFGYFSGRLGLIGSSETRSLNVFVSYFALPAVAFKALATIALDQVNWRFLAALALGKAVVFVAVAALTLLLVQRPSSFGKAGLYAIAATQSNDFGLGYPLISRLYDKSQPTFSHYLYLIAPVQLIFLNPIAFLFMEYSRSEDGTTQRPLSRRLLYTVAGILKNPVVIAPTLGVIWNIAAGGKNPPYVLQRILDSLADAFIGSALFLLGLNMVGQLTSMGKYAALTPVLLVCAKILAVPLVIREIVNLLQVGATERDARDFSNFGFLFGMLPMAPSVFIFATQYGLPTAAVSTAMVAGTFLSAPFIFISATMSQIKRGGLGDFFVTLGNAMVYSGLISAVCCIWLLVVLWRKHDRAVHGTTFLLVICQLATAVGGALWAVCDPDDSSSVLGYVQSVLSVTGIFASRIWTATLATLLALLHWRSLCFVLRVKWIFVVTGFGTSLLVALTLCFSIPKRGSRLGSADPNFQFGDMQAILAVSVLVASLLVTTVSLVFQQRFRLQTRGYALLGGSSSDNEEDQGRETLNVSTPALTSQTGPLSGGGDSNDCNGDCDNCGTCSGEEDHRDVKDLEDIADKPRRKKHAKLKGSSINTTQSDMMLPSTSSGAVRTADHLCGPEFNCDKEQIKECMSIVESYQQRTLRERDGHDEVVEVEGWSTCDEDPHEVFQHLVLLLLLSTSMVVGLAVSCWQLLVADAPTGILIELEFLDIVLNYGQGLLTFLVFGLDTKWLLQRMSRLWNYLANGLRPGRDTSATLPREEDLPSETRQICIQFRAYHYASCIADIAAQRQGLDGTMIGSAFFGCELVDWLMAVGLCQDRMQATRYGRRLLEGRVIRHATGRQHFQDEPYTYIFVPPVQPQES